MIKMMTAYTTEVDEVDDALNEIFSQIDLTALRKNSAGLVTCHFDFTDTGFIDALCKKLPFDVIGMTTMASANEHGFDMYALSLTVFTSDDVSFETAITDPLSIGSYQEEINAAYTQAAGKLDGEPALVIGFFPYLKDLSGALQLRALDKICGGVPIWGSLTTNIEISYEYCRAFRNGGAGEKALAMLLMHGPVDPEFIVISLPDANIRKNRGIITDSADCVLKEVNGIPAFKYLESLGINVIESASYVTPMMVYYEGASVPVALGVYSIKEDGSLLSGGEMTKGASIALGEISSDGILSSAREGINRILQTGKSNGALLLPCVSRYVMLDQKHDGEMELVTQLLKDVMPFMLGYSGGEVCPVRDDSGRLQNRFHNYTFMACVL